MKYIVFYVENCGPKVKYLKTKKQALIFVAILENMFGEDNWHSWVDCVIKGEVIRKYPNWFGISEDK